MTKLYGFHEGTLIGLRPITVSRSVFVTAAHRSVPVLCPAYISRQEAWPEEGRSGVVAAHKEEHQMALRSVLRRASLCTGWAFTARRSTDQRDQHHRRVPIPCSRCGVHLRSRGMRTRRIIATRVAHKHAIRSCESFHTQVSQKCLSKFLAWSSAFTAYFLLRTNLT